MDFSELSPVVGEVVTIFSYNNFPFSSKLQDVAPASKEALALAKVPRTVTPTYPKQVQSMICPACVVYLSCICCVKAFNHKKGDFKTCCEDMSEPFIANDK